MHTRTKRASLIASTLSIALLNASWASATEIAAAPGRRTQATYAAMVQRVAALPEDQEAQALAARRRLQILNVLWEDTGRWLGSSVGPNISDVTIEVETKRGGRTQTVLMPVLRTPNFTDVTGDVPLSKLRIPVGNHRPGWKPGDALDTVSLREFLAEPGKYLTLPQGGTIKGGTLLAARDRHALVSAQATFLPVPKQGTATFWPVIFNYQSQRKNPAVLTLLVTRQGTSATIIDNARDTVGGGASWGQRIFFNAGGERAPLTAERLSAVKATGVTSNGEAASSLGGDANLLMLVQIPLKHREPRRPKMAYKDSIAVEDDPLAGLANGEGLAQAPAAGPEGELRRRGGRVAPRPDVETAVLGHGPVLGPYTELDGLTIERDPRFPVRVTVQFYQATSNGVLSAAVVKTLGQRLQRVYQSADYVGSLVTPAPGAPVRPTAWQGTSPPPANVSASDFPGLCERAAEGKPLLSSGGIISLQR